MTTGSPYRAPDRNLQGRSKLLAAGAALLVTVLLIVVFLTRGSEEPVALTTTEPTAEPLAPAPVVEPSSSASAPAPSASATPTGPTARPAKPGGPTGPAPRARTGTAAMGVYRGAGGWGAEGVPAYDKFLGGKAGYVLDFQATDTWDNQEWPGWQADAWKKVDRTLVLGATGIFPGDWNRNLNGRQVGWAQAAAGEYDAHWRRLGQRLVAAGQEDAVLRGAHEFNGGWFPHRVEEDEAEDFTKAWQRWVTLMRKVPGNRFTFDWNPTVGQEALRNPEVAYPGDAYVDRIALDVYDGWYNRGWNAGGTPPSEAERDKVWNEILNGERGLLYWKRFARTHGKPMSFPEWGIRVWKESDGQIHGGGDNPKFIERMHAILTDPSWNVDYHAFWEDAGSGGAGVSDADGKRDVPVPHARRAFLRLFGPA